MTLRRILIIATLLAGAIPVTIALSEWKNVTPTKTKPSIIKSKKIDLEYFPLSEGTPAAVKVTGPGKLRIITRIVLTNKKKEAVYGIVIIKDGQERKLLSRTAKHSTAKVVDSPKTRLGQPKTITVNVPTGEHEYQALLPQDSKHAGFVRFQFTPVKPKTKPAKIEYIAFLPRKPQEEVAIQIREQDYICYRATSDAPVELEVIGPTKVKVIARLEFDFSMRGDKPFRVQVSENDHVVQTVPFVGKVSGAATYSKTSSKVIGRGETFYFDVPVGKHRYLITTPDKGTSVLLRFYLPQKDLGNEWKPSQHSSNMNGSADLVPKRVKPDKG